MSKTKTYVCSTGGPFCNATFSRFTDFKRHEALHSTNGYLCTWPGCDFATMTKSNYKIHSAKHTGEQRYICPHDDCDYKTHDPAQLTRHRQKKHGYIPHARGRGAPSAKGSGATESSSQSHPPVQPLPSGYQYPTQYQPPQPVYNQSLGVLYGSAGTADDSVMYTGSAIAPNGWTEGCMCPELMQRRPSEMPGYEYRRY
ncbi:uncharacterized protein EDB93DRAFT_1249390 [Suillus bovinus]|uniref:uncharacterized protein n=1 Tax=Suillus bovinus TaxID=48563 RepID=UPI001B87B411|nr:uncharacterized protein EDB93DRAFT_1249390 [Suillus bovinus]KAG2151198.1 hypothetical protein EDB93DRAFT_1249390 [Suillus bovinus]